MIAKFNSIDRLILRSIAQCLSAVADKDFVENSYAYRDGRSTLDAAVLAASYINDGYEWVCEIDVKGFFYSYVENI